MPPLQHTPVFITPHSHIIVTSTEEWTNALSTIRGGGNNKSYIIEVSGDFNVAGTSSSFGTVTGITVTLQGNGKLTLNSNGSIVWLTDNQTLVIDDANLTLAGRGLNISNSTSLVYVSGTNTRLELKNGTISNNGHFYATGNIYGGGVEVYNGSFTMSGGTISGNRVYVNSGNTTNDNGSGVYKSGGTFTVGGTAQIYDNTSSVPNNVYLTNGQYITIGSGSNAPTYGMNIHVRTATASGVIVESSATVETGQYFHADQSDKAVLLFGDQLVIEYQGMGRVGSITLPAWQEGSAISLSAPPVVGLPAGESVTAQGWQTSDNGNDDWSNFTPPAAADISYNGKYLRYYATSSGGQTYYSNTATIRVISQTAREVTIDMYDSVGDGWDGNGALRIVVNGTQIATGVKVKTHLWCITPTHRPARRLPPVIITVGTATTHWSLGCAVQWTA